LAYDITILPIPHLTSLTKITQRYERWYDHYTTGGQFNAVLLSFFQLITSPGHVRILFSYIR